MMKLGQVKGTWLMVCVCVAGSITLLATEAFAVAVKVVDASAATSLTGTEVKFELDEGDPVIRTVGQGGTVDVPANVTERNVRACYQKVVKNGETKWEPIPCGWFGLPGGMAAASSSGWATRNDSNWKFDATFSLGGTASLGNTNATTTGGGLAAGQGTSGLNGLGGTTGSIMLRAHLPLKWTGPLGDLWTFARYNQHFDRTGTGGEANLHNPVPGNESSTSLKRGSDIEVGIGKSFQTYCHQGDVGCQYIGVYAGASIQYNRVTVSSNEIVRAPSFEHSAWKPSVVTGAWYQVPLGGIGTGWNDYSLVAGVDFRRVPCMSVDGATPLPATYRGVTDSFWEVTTWGGLTVAF